MSFQFEITNKLQVTCGTRGSLDPPCNAVGYIDRLVLGINHMYQHPAWRRSKVCILVQSVLTQLFLSHFGYFCLYLDLLCYLLLMRLCVFHLPKAVQACTESSPYEGPFRADAPPWCQAPFEPEGVLRSALLHISIIFFC